MGLVANLFALFLPDIIGEQGLTNAQGSWLTTTRSLFTPASMLVVNQLCDRFGLRKVMTLGCGLTAVAYLLLSGASSFAECCFSCALLGIGYCFSGPVPVALMLGRWFESAAVWRWVCPPPVPAFLMWRSFSAARATAKCW